MKLQIILEVTFQIIILVKGQMPVGYQESTYTKTQIRYSNCDPSTQISDSIYPRRMQCSQLCARNVECRRYQYCSSDFSCKLFKDGDDCMLANRATGCVCYKKNKGCIDGTCSCPLGYYGSECTNIIRDCNHGTQLGMSSAIDIITTIKPTLSPEPFPVLCTFGYGGWTVVHFQSRDCESGQFNKTLLEYREGFGDNVLKNGWLGFDKLLYILGGANTPRKLGLVIYRTDGSFCVNHYNQFRLGRPAQFYAFQSTSVGLNYPGGTGCGNSITGAINLNGRQFSTYDSDWTGPFQCASQFGAGWWYSDTNPSCTNSLLTGSTDGTGTDLFWNEGLSGVVIQSVLIKIQT